MDATDVILAGLVLTAMAAIAAVDARRMVIDPRLVLLLVGAGLLWRLFGPAETGSLWSAALGAGLGLAVVAVPHRGGRAVPPALAALSRRRHAAGRPGLRARPARACLVTASGLGVRALAPALSAAPPGPPVPPGLLSAGARHGRGRRGGVRVRERRRIAGGGRGRRGAAAAPTRPGPIGTGNLDAGRDGARTGACAAPRFPGSHADRRPGGRSAAVRGRDGTHREARRRGRRSAGAACACGRGRRDAARAACDGSRIRGTAAGPAGSGRDAHRLRLDLERRRHRLLSPLGHRAARGRGAEHGSGRHGRGHGVATRAVPGSWTSRATKPFATCWRTGARWPGGR